MYNKPYICKVINILRIFATMSLAIGALLISTAIYIIHNKFVHINNDEINVAALEEREERPYVLLSIGLCALSFIVEAVILYLRWKIKEL